MQKNKIISINKIEPDISIKKPTLNNILVLGSGMVARPGIQYLLKQKHLNVTVASRNREKARKIINGFDNGKAVQIKIDNKKAVENLIKKHDIVISLLPWVFHTKIAKLCLKNNKHMATASYVKPEMKALDTEAQKKDLLILNEMGVDPGIDHMSAMKIIDEVKAEGGKILSFHSFCGGLPAPENNDNPFGYKFSWSPKGVLLASRNSAKYLKDNKEVNIPGKELFLNITQEEVKGLGKFEVYPNRDSLQYKKIYNLDNAKTIMRGTYRNLGWCETLKAIGDLGLLDSSPHKKLKGISYRKMMSKLIKSYFQKNIEKKIAKKLKISLKSDIMKRLTWLGLFIKR
ncbi:saccharopine dehydrogenase C-terminal domain-containing protein [Candidatus Margulisiibacteriota bacterium]